jgi:hypothetical protein
MSKWDRGGEEMSNEDAAQGKMKEPVGVEP